MNKKSWIFILAAIACAALGWFGVPALASRDTRMPALFALSGLQELLLFAAPALLLYSGLMDIRKRLKALFQVSNSFYTGLTMLSAVAFSLTGALITFAFYLLLHSLGISPVLPDPIIPKRPMELVISLLMIAIIAPICEELLFRGFLLDWFKHRLSPRAAMWGNAILFALAHRSLLGFPLYLVIGLLLSKLRLRRNTLLLPILFHGMYNTSILIVNYTGAEPGLGPMLLCAGIFYVAIRPLLQAEHQETPTNSL